MAFNFGQFNEFSDSVTKGSPVVMAVAKAISMGPYKGVFYQAMKAPEKTIDQKTFKIYSRTKTSRDGAIGSGWTDSATSSLGINSDNLKGLTVGHVLSIGSEIVIISDVNRTANTISVLERGGANTTASAHTSGDQYKVIGFAGNDTDLKNVESMSEATNEWENYIQTIFETIDWTKHGELKRQGMEEENAIFVLVREAEIRVAEILSRMAILGVKYKGTNSSDRYMSAGLIAQLSNNSRGALTYDCAGGFTETKLKAALKSLFDTGGMANTIWVNPTQKSWVNAFFGANGTIITDTAKNHTAGGVYIDAYDYEGLKLDIKIDIDVPSDKIAITNQSKCKKGWLSDDGLRLVDEIGASSREKRKSIQGSIGFMIEDVGVDHILLTGITGGDSSKTFPVEVTNTVNVTGDVTTTEATA